MRCDKDVGGRVKESKVMWVELVSKSLYLDQRTGRRQKVSERGLEPDLRDRRGIGRPEGRIVRGGGVRR